MNIPLCEGSLPPPHVLCITWPVMNNLCFDRGSAPLCLWLRSLFVKLYHSPGTPLQSIRSRSWLKPAYSERFIWHFALLEHVGSACSQKMRASFIHWFMRNSCWSIRFAETTCTYLVTSTNEILVRVDACFGVVDVSVSHFLTEQNLFTCEWACERTWSGNYVETGFLMFQLSAIVSQSHQIVQSAGWCFKKCTNKWCFFLGKKTCMVCAVFMRLICALYNISVQFLKSNINSEYINGAIKIRSSLDSFLKHNSKPNQTYKCHTTRQ